MALTKRFGSFQPFIQSSGEDREGGIRIGFVTYNDNDEYLISALSITGRSDHLMSSINDLRDAETKPLSASSPLESDKQILRAKSESKTTNVVVKPSDATLTESVT